MGIKSGKNKKRNSIEQTLNNKSIFIKITL